MITDKQTAFSEAQALTSGTALSTNNYDLVATRNLGRVDHLRLFVNVGTAFAGGTSVQVNVIESNNADMSSPSIIRTGTSIATASLTAGATLLDIAMVNTTRRYLGLQYVVVGTMTAGTVNAGIVMDTDSGDRFAGNTGL